MKIVLAMPAACLLLFGLAWASGDEPVEKVSKEFPFTGEKLVKVNLDFGMGQLSVSRCEGDFVARIHGEYDSDEFKYTCTYDKSGSEGTLVLKVESRSHFGLGSGDHPNDWEIELGSRAPIDLLVDAGMAETDFDFTGLSLTGLDLDLGMNSGKVVFDQPNPSVIDKFTIDAGKSSMSIYGLGNANFRELNIDCGMSSLELDFTGKAALQGEVFMEVGMGSVDILLPHEAGIKIYAEDNWFSSVDIPEHKFDKVDKGVYVSDDFETAKDRLTFHLDVGMGSVDFKLGEEL